MKETVDIDIFVTSRNGDRKIMQSIRTTRRPPSGYKEAEPVEPVQVKIYQCNTYRKDLSWLHFGDEPRVQEMQQVKDQQSRISALLQTFFNCYSAAPRPTLGHSLGGSLIHLILTTALLHFRPN